LNKRPVAACCCFTTHVLKCRPGSWRILLEVFVRRQETASTLITSNRPTQDWGIFLGDVPAANAILDRFLAHATMV
jgi:hypothetical protein